MGRHRVVQTAARTATDQPRWNEVLQALREARGVTQEGWGARLGVSVRTVQRWERGERVPDPGAEAGILAYCGERGLFRTYDRGPLAGLSLSAESLQALLSEARLAAGARAGADRPPVPPDQRSNLPAQTSSFVGREQERAALRRALGATRLLTLTGAGGCGKTRLALELAGELLWAYPHGVRFVELSALADPALVPETVAAALNLRTTGLQPVATVLVEHLAQRHLLLILDNCEHLLSACGVLVETLLRACPHLEVMLTSREPLRIIGETIRRIPPLSPPDAARLFVERARLYQPQIDLTAADEAAIGEICRRLDGIPLAIELAAARVSALSIEQIAERLDDRFRLLTTGSRTALPRQQTLRGALDWSYDLLSEPEQALLRALSVFAGGFTLEAAEVVCDDLTPRPPTLTGKEEPGSTEAANFSSVSTKLIPIQPSPTSTPPSLRWKGAGGSAFDVLDTLTYLVDKSLVNAHHRDGAVRYGLLETVRRYAGEKLESAGETVAARRRHRGWCLALVERAEPELLGPNQAVWLAHLEEEHDNLRAALAWSLAGIPERSPSLGVSGAKPPQWGVGSERMRRVSTPPNPKEAETALRLTGALTRFWERRGHQSEGRQWLARALATAQDAPAEARAKALHSAGVLAGLQGDYTAARAFYERSLNLYRELSYARGIAEAQGNLGRMVFRQGQYESARTLLEASLLLHRDVGNKLGETSVQGTLGELALRQGNYAEAQALFEAKLTHQRELGNTEGIADALEDLATVAGEQGDADRQSALLEESLLHFRALGDPAGVALVLGNLGIAAWTRDDSDRARSLLEESLALYRQVDDRRGIARLLANLSFLALHQRDHTRATVLARESLVLYRGLGDPWGIGRYLPVLAGAAFAQGHPERAARLFGAAAALRERLGTPLPPVVQPTHDRAVAAVRTALGEVDFEAAWAKGASMSPDEALAEALQDAAP